MKKLLFTAILLGIFVSPVVYAQEVTLTQEAKTELIVQLEAKLQVLLNEAIKLLMEQLNKQSTTLGSIETKIDNLSIPSVGAVSELYTPVTVTESNPIITLGEQECRFGDPIMKINVSNYNFVNGVSEMKGISTGTPETVGGLSILPAYYKNYKKEGDSYPFLGTSATGTYSYTINLYNKDNSVVASKTGEVTFTDCK